MLKRRPRKEFTRLNLVPILDAVFIFIFFLLLSAQFIDVHEIGSDVPSIKTIKPEEQKRPPLNLVLEVTEKELILKTGVPERIHSTYQRHLPEQAELQQLYQTLLTLKSQHPDERSIIFRPNQQIPYKDLVKIMDIVRSRMEDPNQTNAELAPLLFGQIIYET